MATRVTLLINPFASSVTARSRILIQRRLSDHFDLSVIETTKRGHAIRLAYRAGRDGTDVVIGLGGDGTINEVANGLLGMETAAAPLPGGSTNVFARALGFPNDPVAATEVLIEAIEQRSRVSAGVGVANGRAFLFHVGFGFDAAVVERVEARGTIKRYAGHPLFVAATIDTWLRRVDRRTPWFDILDADGVNLGSYHLAIALNCNPYTYLGSRPLELAPEADLGRALSVVGLRSLSLRHMVGAVGQAFGRGGEAEPDGEPLGGIGNSVTTAHFCDLPALTVVGHRPFPFQMDGESCGWVDRLEIEHRPDALSVVVPADRPSCSTNRAGRPHQA
ncbi:MAG: diacylglycerol kinase family protein [Acidimicrobiia bacterium]|nr:diacylglycerol kinase family protein [Acidimicrobiia bacterium]